MPPPAQGKHYGVPGINVDGQDMVQMMKAGRAITDYVRHNGPAIMQVRVWWTLWLCLCA